MGILTGLRSTGYILLGFLTLVGVVGVTEAEGQRGRWFTPPDRGSESDRADPDRSDRAQRDSRDRRGADSRRSSGTDRERIARAAPDDRADRSEPRPPSLDEETALSRGRYAVLIDLDENRLFFMEGETVLWSAPVGTGTGMRVITDDNDWEFSTPTGQFEVQYKELDPVWIAPDWYFVENNLPVPPANHRSRYMQGTLGVAAVYISPHLAIHGTDRPELIGQRVSHGCIRLENRYAMRLYHNVQVGTEVIIVGGEEVRKNARVVDLRDGYDPSLASRGGRREAKVDEQLEEWKAMSTAELLEQLDRELLKTAQASRWDEIAILVLDRAVDHDDADAEALLGLVRRSLDLPNSRIEREWATFLADAYRRAGVRTLESIARLSVRDREEVATLLVDGMLTLFRGDFDSPAVPWPSHRIVAEDLSPWAERGWRALLKAEAAYRETLAPRETPELEREILEDEIGVQAHR